MVIEAAEAQGPYAEDKFTESLTNDRSCKYLGESGPWFIYITCAKDNWVARLALTPTDDFIQWLSYIKMA